MTLGTAIQQAYDQSYIVYWENRLIINAIKTLVCQIK